MDVLHYDVRLDPDLAGKRLTGRMAIDLAITQDGTDAIEFDAGELDIDTVRERGIPLSFRKGGARLRVELAKTANAGDRHRIEIDYHGAPRFGLEFHPERDEMYTVFSTSQWMVCVDAPEERATLDLSIALPAARVSIGNGRALAKSPLESGRELHRWRLTTAMPSYVYGLAAGPYTQVSDRNAGVELRYLSSESDAGQLRRIFADSGDMLRFFGRRAGVPYRGGYTQALVANTVGQEHAGFSLMSEQYGREVLEDPTNVSLIAHELAHQWWGNQVTCRDWNHFWLNEGFATFMAAAYLQHRFGDVEYASVVERWRAQVEKLHASGGDRPLVFTDWSSPSADDRAVVYQKGAYVLHLLREELGERAFWKGIRAYTRRHYGQPVVTVDFEREMERSSKRDL